MDSKLNLNSLLHDKQMLTKIASETLPMFADRDVFPTEGQLLMLAMNHSHNCRFSFQPRWYRTFLSIVIQIFAVAKPWALVLLTAILADFSVLVLFEDLRRYK